MGNSDAICQVQDAIIFWLCFVYSYENKLVVWLNRFDKFHTQILLMYLMLNSDGLCSQSARIVFVHVSWASLNYSSNKGGCCVCFRPPNWQTFKLRMGCCAYVECGSIYITFEEQSFTTEYVICQFIRLV